MNFDSRSEFFDSEMVQASLEEIKELQDLITNGIIESAFSSATCLLYTSPSPRDAESSRMPSSA